jgi:hypothetical protein
MRPAACHIYLSQMMMAQRFNYYNWILTAPAHHHRSLFPAGFVCLAPFTASAECFLCDSFDFHDDFISQPTPASA